MSRYFVLLLFGLLLVLSGCPDTRGGSRMVVHDMRDYSGNAYKYKPYYGNLGTGSYDNGQSGQSYNKAIGDVTIVVDAGHGGKDPGTKGVNGYVEKDIVLTIAKHLRDILSQRGARVIMTRNSDVYITLDGRAEIAERNRADLLVSVHADYISKRNISGATVLVGETASAKSKSAAGYVKRALEDAGIGTRATRSQNLRVCQGHSRPAILVEAGFLSNSTEAAKLIDPWYQKKVAIAIADGLTKFFN